jgi:hypothetical protein
MAVDRYDPGQAMQVSETLTMMKPNCIFTQVPPDHPVFISSSTTFSSSWASFLKGKGGNFLVRPRPEILQDTLMNNEKIGKFLRSVLLNGRDFCYNSSNVVYTQHPSFFANVRNSEFQADCFFSALLFHANNPSVVGCSVAADIPELIYRDRVVRAVELRTLNEAFLQFFDELEDKNHDFDFRKLDPDLMLRPKSEYMAELLKQLAGTYKLIAAVVDHNNLKTLEEEWQNLRPEPVEIKSFMDIPPPKFECSLLEYLEKHVLVELMLGLFIEPYFIKHGIFPYSGVGMIGNEGFYTKFIEGWKYYYTTHSEKLKKLIDTLIASAAVKNTRNEKPSSKKDKFSGLSEKERHEARKIKKAEGFSLNSDES